MSVGAFASLLADRIEPSLNDTPARERWPTPGALAKALDAATVQTPALTLIDTELVRLADGPGDRLMVFMPPQEGKSVRVAQRFVEWLLVQNRNLRVAIVSYSDEIARRWGSDIKLDALTYDGAESAINLDLRLRDDTRAAGRWQIDGHAGGVYCVGVGGSLTGRPVDVLVIDDPIKDLEQAQSPKYRERALRFWRAVAVPRLGPGSKVVLIQTRWHEADLGGQLLREEPDRWRVVSIPALAEADDDPLGRNIGEPMVSARGQRDWDGIRRSVGEYVWSALYQQRPAPAEGGIFTRSKFRFWHPMSSSDDRQRIDLAGRAMPLDACWCFATVDLAASTRTSADYTAVAAWAVTPDADLVLLDMERKRIGEEQHWPLVRRVRERWGCDAVYVESRMFGTTLVRDAALENVAVVELRADTDKLTRALPASSRLDAGRLWVPAGAPWLDDYLDELAGFPNAAHDDQVDVTAYAARVVSANFVAPGFDPDLPRDREGELVTSALGLNGDVDFLKIPY